MIFFFHTFVQMTPEVPRYFEESGNLVPLTREVEEVLVTAFIKYKSRKKTYLAGQLKATADHFLRAQIKYNTVFMCYQYTP